MPYGTRPGTRQLFAVLLQLFALAAVAVGAENSTVVFHDDFEETAKANPPHYWRMWGAEKYKDPLNYTLDSTQPHGGKGCFRIHHPAGTEGYICLAPEFAIHPKPGMIYSFHFWARTAKPGKSGFSITAYQTINPFVDVTKPGVLPLETGTEWRAYDLEIREGLNFSASESRYLMPTFNAASSKKEEQTLWVDDFEVSERLDPNPAKLLNAATIAHEPLAHRLRPGTQLEFTIDAAQKLRAANLDAGGVAFHRVVGWTGQPYDWSGKYTLKPELETAIREMHLPMTRFYGVGDEPISLEASIDRVAEMCQRSGVPETHCVLEFERQSAATKLPPEVWARGVKYSNDHGYKFRYWEIANEPYANLWGQNTAFPSPDAFAEHAKAVSRAIRAVSPAAQIGFDFEPRNNLWGNYLLQQLAGYYDFAAGHYYCHASVLKLPFEEITLTENYRRLDDALRMNALLRAYNPGREVYQYDTEWGLSGDGPNGEEADFLDRNANIVGTVHRAIRLIYYAREEILRGASGWNMFASVKQQGFGILSQDAPDQRFMLYWLHYYFNRSVGETVLPLDGTAPFYQPKNEIDRKDFGGPITPVLATRSKDQKTIYLVIANGSWTQAVPCALHLRNFNPAQASGIRLSNDQLDAKPLLQRKEDLVSDFRVQLAGKEMTCTIPPHAVVFVTLTQ